MAKPGRKPLKDKAVPLTIYVKKSLVKENGGAKSCRIDLKGYADAGFPEFFTGNRR